MVRVGMNVDIRIETVSLVFQLEHRINNSPVVTKRLFLNHFDPTNLKLRQMSALVTAP